MEDRRPRRAFIFVAGAAVPEGRPWLRRGLFGLALDRIGYRPNEAQSPENPCMG